MARAERIEAQLSLLALLQRRIEIGKLTLIGPNILFEWVGGRPNWVFEGEAGQPATPAVTLDIQAVHVRNGMVTIHLPTRTHVVGIRALDFHDPAADGPLDLTSVLVYSDYRPFTFRAKARAAGGGAWTTRLEAAAYGAAFSAEGRMSLDGDYDLQVKGRAPELAKLNALLPPLNLPAVHGLTFASHLTNGSALGDLPVIGQTRLEFAGMELADRVPGLSLGATEASLPAAGAAASVSGSGRYAQAGFSFGGTVGVPKHLTARFSTPVDLTARAAVVAKGASPAVQSDLAVQGQLSVAAGLFAGLDATARLHMPSLAAWQPMLSPTLSTLGDVTIQGRLGLSADLRVIRLRKASVSANALDLTGDASVGLGATPSLKGQLHASKLDLDTLLEALPPTGARPAKPAARIIPDTKLPWAMLRGRSVDVTANIAAVTLKRQVWHDVSFALRLADGRLQLDRFRLALPAGPLEMQASADASRQEVPFSLSLHAPGIPLALVVREAGLPGQATGALRVETQLKATGSSLHDLAASLDGPFSATLTHGSVSNAALTELASASLEALGIQVPKQGETAIHCFGLIGAFQAGVGKFPTIALNSTYLDVSGVGQVDLGAETLALRLYPMARLAGSSVSVPVIIEGPLRSAQGRLDASGLDRLGLLIDALFGGDQARTCSEAGLQPSQPKPR
jgi:AsmA protein